MSPPSDAEGRRRLYVDVAHPISIASRMTVERAVVAEYERELERSRQPGYAPRRDDLGDVEFLAPALSHGTGGHPGAEVPSRACTGVAEGSQPSR
jgi:stage V sporulation protein G